MDMQKNVFTDFKNLRDSFQDAEPFPYIIIDDFLDLELAKNIESEFPDIKDEVWYQYDNPIENKKVFNHWERFPKYTYQLFSFLNSSFFVSKLEELFTKITLCPDMGLNGGGWHIHGPGGKLNVHLDYSTHPKLELERRLNIIIYIADDWEDSWGGGLGLYTHDEHNFAPKDLVKTVMPKFNRAVIFDTTCNSWHGLPEKITCPEGKARKSLAIYYLSEPRDSSSKRGKALFAPHKEQKHDKSILELIKKRSQVSSAKSTYKKNKDKDKK
jgi:Rps23 Pro-64 3,4-dihydroxylase Tpa1-like proline 4-hydroxylase